MMTSENEVSTGSFCWVDMAVSDARAMLEFFTELFGWGRRVRPTQDAHAYSIFTTRGTHIAGLFEVPEQGPSQWMSYALVDDLDEATRKAVSLGATVIREALEIAGFGRMSVISDPTDVVFALWESARGGEKTPAGGFGIVSWNELITPEPSRAREFYTQMFGWTCDTVSFGELEYTVFMNGEQQAAGMMPAEHSRANPSHWLVHFSVEDCDETVARVKELGGGVVLEPTDFEGVGRSAVVTDPSGGVFGVITLVGPSMATGD